jgi:hypothetical protein
MKRMDIARCVPWVMLTCAAVGFAVGGGQQRHEPYPGQGEHAEPPKGWFCSSHPSAPRDHKCDCKKTCAKPTDEDGNTIDGPMIVTEDARCTVFCHKDHCACEVKCAETE